MAQSRKSSDAVQRKESSSSDPFKDLPIVWIIGNLCLFLTYDKDYFCYIFDNKCGFCKPFYHIHLGGPGSGRSTQCQLLSIYSGLCHVSSGETLKREILSGTSFDSELQCKWEQDICRCAASLMESHTPSTINCDELEKNGQGFMVYLGDASQHRDYFALATTACKKRNDLPHGDSTYHVAASQILEDIILKSATAAGIPRNLALRLSLLIV